MPAARTVRDAIDVYFGGEGEAAIHRFRDPKDRVAMPSRERGRWLLSSAGREALAEAHESHELGEHEVERLQRQVDRVAYSRAMLAAELRLEGDLRDVAGASGEPIHVREELARIAAASDARRRATAGLELDHALRGVSSRWLAGCMRAEEPLLREAKALAAPRAAERRSPGGLLIVTSLEAALAASDPAAATRVLPREAWSEDAAAFLSSTDDVAEDAVRFCTRAFSQQYPLPWTAWLRGMRAPELDSTSGARQRWRRVAAWLRVLGFEREMSKRLRAEVDALGVAPFSRVTPVDMPRDVRVAQGAIDYGVASDLFACEAVGRATGLALVLPTLPAELRWPLPGCCSDALGGLSGQLWGDRGHLTRVQGMHATEAERVGRLSATLHLLTARFACSVALAELDGIADPGERAEALAEVTTRALGCDMPASLAGLLGGDRPALAARARGMLAGLSLHWSLRERFDEDWYRDRRAAEPLRAACARGNGLMAEGFLSELGGAPCDAARRAAELLT